MAAAVVRLHRTLSDLEESVRARLEMERSIPTNERGKSSQEDTLFRAQLAGSDSRYPV